MCKPLADFWWDLTLFYREEDLSYIFEHFVWTYGPLISLSNGGLYVDINQNQEERRNKTLIFFIKTLFTSNVFAEAYSKPCHTSKMETFLKTVVKY